MKKKSKNKARVSAKKIEATVAQSSRMEGMNFSRAKKNKTAIKLLKQYGRAFSI